MGTADSTRLQGEFVVIMRDSEFLAWCKEHCSLFLHDCLQLLYVSGQPLGMPKIENPTQEDIDKWHAKYCSEVKRLFDTYKERVPEYKHKQLEIV